MAGTLTLTRTEGRSGRYTRFTGTATSSAGGAADSTTMPIIVGKLKHVAAKPGAGVSSGWAFTLKNANSRDLMGGAGATSLTDNTNGTETVYLPIAADGYLPAINGTWTLNATGMGSATSIDFEVLIDER